MPGDADQARRHALAEVDDGDRLVVEVDRQPRNERDADARGDERLHRAVVVGAEDDVRLLAGERSRSSTRCVVRQER